MGTFSVASKKASSFPVIDVNGVHDIEEKDQALSFQIDTEELDNVIRYISQFGVVKLESAPPNLEDLFLRHYEGIGETSGTGVGGVS